MKTEKSGVGRWLDGATGGLKFPPDRRAARQELLDHIMDRTEAYRRNFPDMTAGEAERKAVEQMGDPQEVGRALARLHHPWVGFLWYGCRGLLGGAALAVLLLVVLQPKLMNALWDGGISWAVEQADRRFLGLEEEWTAPAPVELDHHTLTVPRAARIEEKWSRPDTNQEVYACESAAITLRIRAKLPWDRPGEGDLAIPARLTAVDSHGKALGLDRWTEEDRFEGQAPILAGRRGVFWQEYELLLRDLTPGAQWVELDYHFGGTQFKIRVDIPAESHYGMGWLTEEEVPG